MYVYSLTLYPAIHLYIPVPTLMCIGNFNRLSHTRVYRVLFYYCEDYYYYMYVPVPGRGGIFVYFNLV